MLKYGWVSQRRRYGVQARHEAGTGVRPMASDRATDLAMEEEAREEIRLRSDKLLGIRASPAQKVNQSPRGDAKARGSSRRHVCRARRAGREGYCIREVRGHGWRESPVFGGLSGHGEGVLNALGKTGLSISPDLGTQNGAEQFLSSQHQKALSGRAAGVLRQHAARNDSDLDAASKEEPGGERMQSKSNHSHRRCNASLMQ